MVPLYNIGYITNYKNEKLSFQINARKQINNSLVFDFTAFPSKIVKILLDALHFDVETIISIPLENKNIVDLLELIIFLLDDGKLR